ncbi:TonB-dependent siderophore receptor [Caulobacter sp. UNC279MFTsu5.1]|uniref:TonB-dependent receptor plug domain-containing protein n=1 Tax=Caulobacter sp. UNC279MFTsu5.1 TaxID=1502775 RepID=UPI000363E351|nr:TonB-dependent receptor [Caulobacter sp. UNC279MFTsu5.1]SFJ07719.1 iron complex outermembrane recepter protein [Caulobacter sp. UNC279MFTsu5.1]
MKPMNSVAWATLALAVAAQANLAQAREETAPRSAADAEASQIDTLVVTGTRRVDRTAFESTAPIDVVTQDALNSIVSDEIMDKLAATTPSFNVQRLPAADGQAFVRPATLRGLSPDQTLVLVNGKRRHRSAVLGGRGQQGVDLASLGTSGVSRIEVLRDGASAQYGSDAIAGVINVILSTKTGFSGYAQTGQYYEGDGRKTEVGARYGLDFGHGGVIVGSVDYADAEATSRTRQRPDAVAFQAANPTIAVRNPVQRWGQPDRIVWRGTLNTILPLTDTVEAYAFATYSDMTGQTDFNWRNPATDTSYRTSPAFPGWSLNQLYPAGFAPVFGQDETNGSLNAGVKGRALGFSWDLSAGYGRDDVDYVLKNSINASFGPQSPTAFDDGSLIQVEKTLNLDASRPLAWSFLAQPANLAVGLEARQETYEIKAGDRYSWDVGPGAAAGLPSGSNGFPGYAPSQAGSWDQTSYAGYVDLDLPITDRFDADIAVRHEDFSEFGSTTDGKIAVRYEVTPDFALRGAVSTGFRAPTPGQINNTRTSQGLNTTTLLLFTSGRLSPVNPIARALGGKPLEPEESRNLSFGAVYRRGGFTGSVDYYRIEVDTRFAVSPNFTVTPALRAQLVAAGVPGADSLTTVSYFTNAFDTRTQGVDVVGSWKGDLWGGRAGVTAAWNWNDSKVIRSKPTEVSRLARINIEDGLPANAANLTLDYGRGRYSGMVRARYSGRWTDAQANGAADLIQTFGGRTLVDLSLSAELNDRFKLTVGAENLFDTYPDEATFQVSRGLIYSRNAPYDTDGGLYYARLSATF